MMMTSQQFEKTVAAIKEFAKQVHDGTLLAANGPFKNLLVIGIGSSAHGPEFVANALGQSGSDTLEPFFFDNTDPDGMERVLVCIGKYLGKSQPGCSVGIDAVLYR
jgi:glucose-6-phosphate isomerase